MHDGDAIQSRNADEGVTPKPRDPAVDRDWFDLAPQWNVREDTIYLNHGSFSPALNPVRYARRQWIQRVDQQPMDFYLRQFEPAMDLARSATARFVGTSKENLIFVDNATYGMNVVAESVDLKPDDEVLINDHEYGAVKRIWERKCQRSGARLICAAFPSRLESPDQILESLLGCVTPKTRLLALSHITSPTALILPVQSICEAFSERGIATCIDGPHAPAQIELNIDRLNCDYYMASCHKWMCAPLGTGFLYVNPRNHHAIAPPIQSWGRLDPAVSETWDDEFTWIGTRDPSGFLSIPDAIKFMENVGLDQFRKRSYWLAEYGEQRLCELFGTVPIASRSEGWYGSMAHVPLPDGDWSGLQQRLWDEIGIEIMIPEFKGKHYLRLSCHLYNNTKQIDTLIRALSRMTIR